MRHARDASRSRGSSRITWQLADHVVAHGSTHSNVSSIAADSPDDPLTRGMAPTWAKEGRGTIRLSRGAGWGVLELGEAMVAGSRPGEGGEESERGEAWWDAAWCAAALASGVNGPRG